MDVRPLWQVFKLDLIWTFWHIGTPYCRWYCTWKNKVTSFVNGSILQSSSYVVFFRGHLVEVREKIQVSITVFQVPRMYLHWEGVFPVQHDQERNQWIIQNHHPVSPDFSIQYHSTQDTGMKTLWFIFVFTYTFILFRVSLFTSQPRWWWI